MDAIEAVAIVILILAILVLIYYYLQNSPATLQKIRSYVPTGADAHMNAFLKQDDDFEYGEPKLEKEENDSMSQKIKVKLSDLDMSGFNTETFSKKFDAFLDEKSDQLIKDWALATKDDLSVLEEKFEKTASSVDDLENQFKKFKKSSKKFQKDTESKLEEIDKRIEALEEK